MGVGLGAAAGEVYISPTVGFNQHHFGRASKPYRYAQYTNRHLPNCSFGTVIIGRDAGRCNELDNPRRLSASRLALPPPPALSAAAVTGRRGKPYGREVPGWWLLAGWTGRLRACLFASKVAEPHGGGLGLAAGPYDFGRPFAIVLAPSRWEVLVRKAARALGQDVLQQTVDCLN